RVIDQEGSIPGLGWLRLTERHIGLRGFEKPRGHERVVRRAGATFFCGERWRVLNLPFHSRLAVRQSRFPAFVDCVPQAREAIPGSPLGLRAAPSAPSLAGYSGLGTALGAEARFTHVPGRAGRTHLEHTFSLTVVAPRSPRRP